MNWIKKILIPSGQKVEVTAYENWTVRWRSRNGQYSGDTQDECEVFLNEEDAKAFVEQLREAFKLIKHTSGTAVSLQKTK